MSQGRLAAGQVSGHLVRSAGTGDSSWLDRLEGRIRILITAVPLRVEREPQGCLVLGSGGGLLREHDLLRLPGLSTCTDGGTRQGSLRADVPALVVRRRQQRLLVLLLHELAGHVLHPIVQHIHLRRRADDIHTLTGDDRPDLEGDAARRRVPILLEQLRRDVAQGLLLRRIHLQDVLWSAH